jgi:aldose 1-epimerase
VPVPISFGWHPYLTLPGVPRTDWRVELPVRRRAELDDRGIPTGESEPVAIEAGPLGDAGYDDLFPELAERPVFALEGGGRRIELAFEEGYPVAQVYAPPDQDFICFEPMTAPTNALVSEDGLRCVQPGETFSASFSIAVTGGGRAAAGPGRSAESRS